MQNSSGLGGPIQPAVSQRKTDQTPASAMADATRNEAVSAMVEAVGPQNLNQCADVDRVRTWFGEAKNFSRIDELCRMLDQGAPADAYSKGLGLIELEYGNRQSAIKHDGLIWGKVLAGVRMGRAITFET